ncbi:deoxyhypusine synthase [Candidatus Micrarchaeota archaeon CG10_big_fil_rev_8_21_14_0_10_45_29]|nr:MAG: deoxyhypusine synthase [Candidatus Micrarchaeota archaeon CG10_big_fil_rev_8_21_14_0_10_45_29]
MANEISNFIKTHYKHFNAATLKDAAEGYKKHIEAGGKMMVTLAGAMSTAELGISLAEMIRAGKVHAISCTGANLEEDLFNLVANKSYKRIPNYRDLTPADEQKLLDSHLNRVTDTCIPEEEAMRKIEAVVLRRWMKTEANDNRLFPHEYLYNIIKSGELEAGYDIEKKNSWLVAAAEKDLPIFIGGWEDSTLGNFFVSNFIKNKIDKMTHMKTGLEYMKELVDWYQKESAGHSIGFFQIGGGIAGDFPICVVPLIEQDLQKNVRKWGYFCQVSDSTTSYGSYSGAVPNEKITWGKLGVETPRYIIESDATIVAPLIFAYVLGW